MDGIIERVIKSTNINQHDIINDIIELYIPCGRIEADITYSTGNFYGRFTDYVIEQPIHKFDVAPMDETITKIEPWGDLPLGDGSIKSCMFDPPFVISPRDSASVKEISKNKKSSLIFKRFSGYYPINELLDSYYHWISEMYRVLEDGGIGIIKCQPTVTGGKQLNSHHYIWFICECLGFDMLDEFILLAKNRLISGKVTKQQHARKYHSYFLVVRKSTNKKPNYLNFLDDDCVRSLIGGFVKNNIGKDNGMNLKYKEEIVPQRENMNKDQ